jgi:mRNA-degrading endonuclease RelE of RelBE toxin-antitoxin system
MALHVEYKETGRGQFLTLNSELQREARDALDLIARSPAKPPFWLDVARVTGQRQGWRLVVRDFRVAYSVLGTRLLVTDIQPGHTLYRSWATKRK